MRCHESQCANRIGELQIQFQVSFKLSQCSLWALRLLLLRLGAWLHLVLGSGVLDELLLHSQSIFICSDLREIKVSCGDSFNLLSIRILNGFTLSRHLVVTFLHFSKSLLLPDSCESLLRGWECRISIAALLGCRTTLICGGNSFRSSGRDLLWGGDGTMSQLSLLHLCQNPKATLRRYKAAHYLLGYIFSASSQKIFKLDGWKFFNYGRFFLNTDLESLFELIQFSLLFI